MAGIEILIDAKSFERAADDHVAREILPRLVRALNDVAAAAKVDVVDAIKTELDGPSPFTVSGVAVFKAKPSATLPLGAAPGAGRLRTITTWRCEGNFLHGFYPIVRVSPDLHFRIVWQENP